MSKGEINKIDIQKILLGFDGSEYCLFEYSPTGYAIFDMKSGLFLESTASSYSPYTGYNENIYYAGPGQYYYFSKNEYTHLLDNIKLSKADVFALTNNNEEITALLRTNIDNQVVNYINDTGVTLPPVRASQTYYVSDYNRLMNLKYCGYITGGYCGYIAAAMLLYYFDSSGHRDLLPGNNNQFYWTSNGSYVLSTSNVTSPLISIGSSLGYGNSTTSYSIHRVMKKYLSNKGITSNLNHTSLFAPLFTKYQIYSRIANSSEPVIIFGSLVSPTNGSSINHAVLAYGCKLTITYNNNGYGTNSYEFIAHFGWDNRTNIYINGIFGSIYSLSC